MREEWKEKEVAKQVFKPVFFITERLFTLKREYKCITHRIVILLSREKKTHPKMIKAGFENFKTSSH